MFRSLVYQRAKKELDTVPFGTEFDVYRVGYEYIHHSLGALDARKVDHDIRIPIGGKGCSKPYSASLLNISAMSYGALTKNAILALNGGAQKGNFAHKTGEGGMSPFHIEPGGDLIWQVGTGYFGTRTKDGSFCPDTFEEKTAEPAVKMIEIKLSQGAKPGHGGILPGSKNTPEIAAIRGVEPHTDVISPPSHSAFDTPVELAELIALMRERSNGKPVGFKLFVGRQSEFLAICKAKVETGISPDFITLDGGEGGTGAAPPEHSSSVGVPLKDGLAFVVDALAGHGLRDDIRIIASGKIITGFHTARVLALGADLTTSARAMMLALGCIQALECNKNVCPTGITTQDANLTAGLIVSDKAERVCNYHNETVRALADLLTASGHRHPEQIERDHIYQRVSTNHIMRYDEIYPPVEPGCMLNGDAPDRYRRYLAEAQTHSFEPLRV